MSPGLVTLLAIAVKLELAGLLRMIAAGGRGRTCFSQARSDYFTEAQDAGQL